MSEGADSATILVEAAEWEQGRSSHCPYTSSHIGGRATVYVMRPHAR